MTPESDFLPPRGEPQAWELLVVSRAHEFAVFLQTMGTESFANFKEARKDKQTGSESIVFTVMVERPQRLVHPILREELLEAVFHPDIDKIPEVFVLRKSFPQAPHQNLTLEELPRQLCLYEQPWDLVRLSWTAGQFLQRTRHWLAKTASGTLHAGDQPLEPLIMPSGSRLILPSDFSFSKFSEGKVLLQIVKAHQNGNETTLTAAWREEAKTSGKHCVAAVFRCEPQTHGVIKHQPQNLLELQLLCSQAGLDLSTLLSDRIQEWHRDKPDASILKSQLIIIIVLPKRRTPEADVTEEIRAFLTGKNVGDVGTILGVIQAHNGMQGYIIGKTGVDDEALRGLQIGMVDTYLALNAEIAAHLNGVAPYQGKIVAIGLGALGSQIFNNMVRAGYGRWALIDPDTLLPHNCARHVLGDWAVGANKATSLAAMADAMLDSSNATAFYAVDVMKPGDAKEKLELELQTADVICDFSASIAVARYLAANGSAVRHCGAYLSPKGDSLVIAIEDTNRAVRLDWLEMLHYRTVLENETIGKGFAEVDSHLRYGNSCRDVSSQIAQDDVAMWAAVASKNLKTLLKYQDPVLRIYTVDESSNTFMTEVIVTPLIETTIGSWLFRMDRTLLDKIGTFRQMRLPNETGGVLIGNFDTLNRVCSIVDFIPSPPDSVEWPVSYIRGCRGLRDRVDEVQRRTLGQITYVGEWHSHPDGIAASPSNEDLKAFSWIDAHMGRESLPAIMLIVGERSKFSFVHVESQ